MPFIAAGAGAVLGGVAGSMKDRSSQNWTSGIRLAPASATENRGLDYLNTGAQDFNKFVAAGPGLNDVQSGLTASQDLAALLQQFANGGNNPSASDFQQGNDLASKLMASQRVGLNQSFQDQLTAYNRQAALSGRSLNDPILRAKLGQEQMRQQAMLDAQQGGLAAQLAMNAPGQRLGFAQQRASLLGGLASQAMANRQALASMGEAIVNNERNFRIATGERYGTGSQESGGGLKGALTGALAGAGTGASIASGFGGGVSAPPAPAQQPSYAMAGASPQAYQAQNYFSGINPYSAAGPGFGASQAPASASGFNYNFGSAYNTQPRSFSLGGY